MVHIKGEICFYRNVKYGVKFYGTLNENGFLFAHKVDTTVDFVQSDVLRLGEHFGRRVLVSNGKPHVSDKKREAIFNSFVSFLEKYLPHVDVHKVNDHVYMTGVYRELKALKGGTS